MNWGRRFLETKTPSSWIREPKHDAQMRATLSKCSAYFTDSSGLDSHPSAARQSLPSVLMWPLPVEEKKPFLSHLPPMCSHPTSLGTAPASEQGLPACLVSIFCTAPCSQHRQQGHLHPSKGEGTSLSTHNPHSPSNTHKSLFSRGHSS